MLSYVTIGAADPAKAHAFYDAVLATIGWSQHTAFGNWRGYGEGGNKEGPGVWVCTPFNGEAATSGNGMMVAFGARTRDQVHAFYEAAMAHGATDEGGPGARPDYGPNWYAAYLRDPTGNKLAIVCFAPAA